MSNALFTGSDINLEDLILSSEQLTSGQYPKNEVYDIKFETTVIGPIWQQDIKQYLQTSGHFDEGTQIKAYDQSEWVHIFEHPFFQRRRPQLVPTQALDSEEVKYHLLVKGQKHGPYTGYEVNAMITNQEILVTDEVSIDDGQSWGQLYEIEDFDRRALKSNEELPSLPTDNIFSNSTEEVEEKLNKFSDEKTSLIAGLAYIGNLQVGKAREGMKDRIKHNQEVNQEEEIPQNRSNRIQDYVWKFLFAVSAVGLVALFITWSNDRPNKGQDQASTKAIKQPVNKIEPIKLTPVKVNNQPRKLEKTITIDRDTKVNERPTSFRRSKAFRQAAEPKKELADDARYPKENDDFYYDDNTSPVELDPVRSTLSKETIDPELGNDGYIDEPEGDYSEGMIDGQEEIYNEEVEY